MAGIFVVLLAIASSRFFLRHFPHPHSQETDSDTARNLAAEHWCRKGIGLLDIAKGLAFAFVAVAGADQLGRLVGGHFPVSSESGLVLQMVLTLLTNQYVLITAVSLAMATIFHRQLQSVNGPGEIGGYMLYIFLFAIGLPADLVAVLWNVPLLFVFCGIIGHFSIIIGF